MTQEEFLRTIAGLLEAVGIPFMVAGSYGSSHHGQPRTSRDIDLVIDATADQLDRFLTMLGDRYYVSRDAAHDALRRRSMFNVIDFDDGWKADLIVRKDRPYSLEEFNRRKMVNIFGSMLPVVSPEDVILTKLEWNRISPSDRQIQDVFHVILVQAARLDREYLRHWAPSLGVRDDLESLFLQADSHNPADRDDS